MNFKRVGGISGGFSFELKSHANSAVVSCDAEDVNENGGGEERGSCFHELCILVCKLYIDLEIGRAHV